MKYIIQIVDVFMVQNGVAFSREFIQIGKLYIAGGFGAHINKASACAIGLLPIELIDRMEFIGNAAGMGARRALLTADGRDRLRALAARAEYIELSGDKFFEERYVEQMLFPEQ